MICISSVSKSYDLGNVWSVRDLDLEVASGELFCLVGGSGGGKSTVLKLINRLIEPTSGRIEVNSRSIEQSDPVTLRRGIGYVIQGIGLFPHLSVARNVGLVPSLLGWDRRQIAARVDELLQLVHLPPNVYRDREPASLSGGQRQRVGLARALAARPPVMLLDEPFGALDPVTRASLTSEYQAIHRSLGLTSMLVTHDMAEALSLADRIGVMTEGRLVRVGTPRELITNPGHPFVEQLLDAPRKHAEHWSELRASEDPPT